MDRVFAKRNGLARGRAVETQGVRIPLRDGVTLGADVFTPDGESKGLLLTMGPYGRAIVAGSMARVYAGQGYTVLFVSSRGTADSGGEFDPMVHEAGDIQDVVAWMRKQPWYPGSFATVGPSYLGFVQWGLLLDPPDDLATAVITVGPHDFARHAWGSGTFNLDLVGWAEMQAVMGSGVGAARAAARLVSSGRRRGRVLTATPMADAAERYFGERAPWLGRRLRQSSLDAPLWIPMRHGAALDRAAIPILLVSGWFDLFQNQTFEQYRRLRERGVDVALTCGPWTHTGLGKESIQDAIAWLDQRLARTGKPRRAPVKVWVTDRWVELEAWPPPGTARELFLSQGRLGEARPDGGEATFRYDPADPTPTVGGPLLSGKGTVDDSRLAARADVLAFDSDPLPADLTVMGTVVVRLAHTAERGDADLLVRLSEVDPRGRSHNVTETYLRLPADATSIELRPTAHRFAKGDRVRLLVAGGSFPQFARNPGSGENPLTATALVPNTHRIQFGASSVVLPTVETVG
jgi:putative CocE/NonD family hydrolase